MNDIIVFQKHKSCSFCDLVRERRIESFLKIEVTTLALKESAFLLSESLKNRHIIESAMQRNFSPSNSETKRLFQKTFYNAFEVLFRRVFKCFIREPMVTTRLKCLRGGNCLACLTKNGVVRDGDIYAWTGRFNRSKLTSRRPEAHEKPDPFLPEIRALTQYLHDIGRLFPA